MRSYTSLSMAIRRWWRSARSAAERSPRSLRVAGSLRRSGTGVRWCDRLRLVVVDDALVVPDDVGARPEPERDEHRPEAADRQRHDRADDAGERAHDDVADGRAAPRGHLVE